MMANVGIALHFLVDARATILFFRHVSSTNCHFFALDPEPAHLVATWG